MLRYYVKYRFCNSNGQPVQLFVGLIDFRSQFYDSESDARMCLDESVSLLVINGFDLISPDGALSPKLMCPDGIHVLKVEVVRCEGHKGKLLR